jgi:hypothetical protein
VAGLVRERQKYQHAFVPERRRGLAKRLVLLSRQDATRRALVAGEGKPLQRIPLGQHATLTITSHSAPVQHGAQREQVVGDDPIAYGLPELNALGGDAPRPTIGDEPIPLAARERLGTTLGAEDPAEHLGAARVVLPRGPFLPGCDLCQIAGEQRA